MLTLQNTNLQAIRQNNGGEYYITKFIKSIRSENTQKAYAKSIYEFFNWKLGSNPIAVKDLIVSADEAGEYNLFIIEMLNRKMIKTSTYNARVKGVRRFYDWLITETYDNATDKHLITINPFRNIKQLDTQGDTEGSDFLTEEELTLMLNNPIGENFHIATRNKLMLILAVTTGIRSNALVSITPDNLQFIENEWCINTLDKGKKPVKKAIKEEYYIELMEWHKEDLKYRTDDNNSIFNITPTTASRIISKWAEYLGISKKITFHSLRTTSAIEVYKLSGNIYEVQKFMGHKEIITTQIYTNKDKQVIKLGKNILENIKHKNSFDELVDNMDTDDMRTLLKSLDSQIKSQLLVKIQK